jgi:hypothetical protein
VIPVSSGLVAQRFPIRSPLYDQIVSNNSRLVVLFVPQVQMNSLGEAVAKYRKEDRDPLKQNITMLPASGIFAT